MTRPSIYPILAAILVTISALALPSLSFAGPSRIPQPASSAYDLINAVNALRASNGLSPYNINSILMYTAQNQADFMAATGTVSHYGPGGSDVTDRLLVAGYPLAGDLSLGGFRSENIISGTEDMTAEAAVDAWTGDAPHLTTMLSPNLTEIGAGVAVSGGRVYYVIDAAHPTIGGTVPVVTQVVGGESTVPAVEAGVPVIVISTPNSDGDIIHDVVSGQTLWQIAVSYNVKIDDIKRLNNLFDDSIYPGEKLLIRTEDAAVTEAPFDLPTVTAPTVPETASSPIPTPTIEPILTQAPAHQARARSETTIGFVIGIIALAILGGGLFTWMGTTRKTTH